MSKPRIAIAMFLVGVLAGAGSEYVFKGSQDRRGREAFEQRLRCKDLAEAYTKENAADYTGIIVERVDFSPARNSCIASISELFGRFGENQRFEVVDLISKETLSMGSCSGSEASRTYCGNGRDMALRQERDKAFENAFKSGMAR